MRITPLKKPVVVVPKEEWVAAALTDDQMVVELLLRLKHAGTVKSENNPATNQPPLRWGFRQRRSRPSRLGIGVGGFMKKETDSSARASPMTPLCWSGGSGSGGSTCPSAATADCFEDTSRQSSCSTSTGSGSKALHGTNEITSCRFKRSKRNKVFLELKDAEKLQLKERFDLQKKIANVQATYEEFSFKNQGLKRIKLECWSDRDKTIPISSSKSNNLDEFRKRTCLPAFISQKHNVSESYRGRRSEAKRSEEKGFFFVPDLNMTPTEEDETLYGTS